MLSNPQLLLLCEPFLEVAQQPHTHCAACCRDISHTPFFVDDKRLGRTSIQEILEELLQPDLCFRSAKLISAGETS